MLVWFSFKVVNFWNAVSRNVKPRVKTGPLFLRSLHLAEAKVLISH